ncbi:hypothetical protein WJS89_05655 [Sphingomicrobium sp. XHP0235]|uniref:hypothetical protein n=1 Tax=Sphingomicrobium aquimarinum TaxID=3133971 RepID=UPI0031FEEC27
MTVTNTNQKAQKELIASLAAFFGEAAPDLDALMTEVRQYGRRRCDTPGSVDNRKYQLGAAFQVHNALGIDGYQLTGLLAAPIAGLCMTALERDDRNLTLAEAFELLLGFEDVRQWAEHMGAYLQWQRLKKLAEQETAEFLALDVSKRENWRKKSITNRQRYLVAKICEFEGRSAPSIAKRGDAFDLIQDAGGNPRFTASPPLPSIWNIQPGGDDE